MGVAGSGAPHETIVVAGLAGLVAGSLSMALGEYLSVQSARELFANELRIEADQLAARPTPRSPSCAASTSRRAFRRGWPRSWPTTWSGATRSSPSIRWRARSWGSIRMSSAVRPGLRQARRSPCLRSGHVPLLPFLFAGGQVALVVAAGLSGVRLVRARLGDHQADREQPRFAPAFGSSPLGPRPPRSPTGSGRLWVPRSADEGPLRAL